MDVLLTLAPTNIPRLGEAAIDAPVLAFALTRLSLPVCSLERCPLAGLAT